MCRDHRHRLTACQKQHRQNEPAGLVDIPTRVEVPVMRGSKTHVGTTERIPPPVKYHTDRMKPAGQVDIATRVKVHVTSHCLSKTTQTE